MESLAFLAGGLKSSSFLVEKLAKELEAEQESLSRKLQKQKEEATLRLKQVRIPSFKLNVIVSLLMITEDIFLPPQSFFFFSQI